METRLEDSIYNVDLSEANPSTYLMSSRDLIRRLLDGTNESTIDRITRRCRDNMGDIVGLPMGFEYFGPIPFSTYIFNLDKSKHYISTHAIRTQDKEEIIEGPKAPTPIQSVEHLFYKLVDIQKPYLGLSTVDATDKKAMYMLSLFGAKKE